MYYGRALQHFTYLLVYIFICIHTFLHRFCAEDFEVLRFTKSLIGYLHDPGELLKKITVPKCLKNNHRESIVNAFNVHK